MTAGSVAVPSIIPLRHPVPGRSKLAIDSNTKIEINSDTVNTSIHYTINGSKPEPFQKIGQKCTIPYRGPFTLPPGRQTVKAIAVSDDGMRESHIVTKTFDVEFVQGPLLPPEDDDLGFQEDLNLQRSKLEIKRAASRLMTSPKSAWNEVGSFKENQQRTSDIRVTGSSHRRPHSGTRFLNSRMGHTTDRSYRTEPLDGLDLARGESRRSARRLPPDNTTQTLRLQRETDFLKCIYCFADRPSDPFCRFCTTCGNPLPEIPNSRITPTEPGQLGMCVYCKSMVPMNTSACIVCEGPMKQQNQPKASVRLSERHVCTLCGTANPSNLVTCVTCDSRLPTSAQHKAIFNGMTAPPVTNLDKKYVRCNKCSRVNNGDARFCDWCGSKPTTPPTVLQCSQCGASNHPYSGYCGGCSVKIEAPGRTEYKVDGSGKFQSLFLPVTQTASISPRPIVHAATQTVGLFYPSRGPNKPETDNDRASFDKQMKERKQLLTPVSPGRGYWRKQVEHICQHLKIFTQNNADFRALIGEPKMGKLITSTIQEDGYELSLTMTFPLRGGSDKQTGKKLGVSHQGYLSQHTQDGIDGYRSDSYEYDSDEIETPKSNKKRITKKPKSKKKLGPKLSALDQQLLKELGNEGEGAATEVQQLLDDGADVNCINKNGLPVIYVAVRNKQIDCIPVLIDGGVDINKKGPSSLKGNTALHDAVNLGPSGVHVIDVLLQNGADQNRKNDRGETPLDLAKKAGYESIITKFASALGMSQLAKMTKPRS